MRHSRRILTTILLLALLVSTFGTAAMADGGLAYGAATVSAAVLNVRSGPGTGNSIVGTVSKGAVVVVLERTNDDWYKINYQGIVGYVSTDYLVSVVTAANFNAKGTLKADSVRVRKGPGTSYDMVASCAFGESVDVIGINNGWYKVVTAANITGYIRSDLLSITGATGSDVGSSDVPTSGTLTGGTTGATQYEGVVWGWGVRFRTGPGTNYDFTASLNPGDKLTIIGVEGDWYKCIYKGVTGYVTTQYVTADPSTATPITPSTPTGEKGTVNGSSVRFRTGPGTSYTVIASLAKGTVVTVLGTEGNWYKCSYDGDEGYISKTYVTLASAGGTTSGGTTGTIGGGTTTDTTVSGTGTVSCTSLRLRSGPSTSSSTITTLSKGTVVTIKGSQNGWLNVTVNGEEGWVSGEYITLGGETSTQTGFVIGTGVRFRTGPGTSYSIICTMPQNASVAIYEKTNGWYKCSYNGTIGYISATYISTTQIDTSGGTTDTSNASLGYQIAQYACQFEGYDYVYGEESPSRGFDCSGLVYYVYHTVYGYSMHRTASTQYRYDGEYVTKSNLQPGDLLFFSSDGSGVTHVGIYVGSGKYGEGTFIHASTSTTGVIYSDLNSSYYTRVYYGAKRIV